MNHLKAFIFFITCILLSVSAAQSARAATMSLNPASASAPVGGTFTVKLTIDTEGESIDATDAILLYDSTILQVVNVVNGDNGQQPFLEDFFNNISPNEIYIGHSLIDMLEPKSGQGVLATITFQGKSTGTAEVRFDCTAGRTSDTNIGKSDNNVTDIVDCARLTSGRYTIGSGQPTATPQPTGIPIPTSTPIPVPVSGSFEITTAVLGMGILLVILALGGRALARV